ncbi:MAG: acyl carrier protein [Cyanobacteria bacterium REEB65]|nr:acyl carrier protein [Cyanobacteria bacterium REEB65]
MSSSPKASQDPGLFDFLVDDEEPQPAIPLPEPPLTPEVLQNWLVAKVAGELWVSPDAVEITRPLSAYGLDSMSGLTLTGDIEKATGLECPQTLVADYPTIEALVGFLVQALQAQDAPS